MRRVLVFTWALGTATGVLLGLFGVQLVSSRFSTAGVSPLSRPEVQRALLAARSVPDRANADPVAPGPGDEVAAAPGRSGGPAPEPSRTGVDRAVPSADPTSSPVTATPASTLPRPGAPAGILVEAGVPASSSTTTAPSGPARQPEPGPGSAHPSGSEPKSKPDSKGDSTANPSGTDGSKGKGSRNQGHDGSGGPQQPDQPPAAPTSTTTTAPPPHSGPPPSATPSAEGSRTISSTGGVVWVRYSGGKVELLSARPNAGYQVYVRSGGPDSVVVYFYTQDKVSRVRAFYRDSIPASDVKDYSDSNQQGQSESDPGDG